MRTPNFESELAPPVNVRKRLHCDWTKAPEVSFSITTLKTIRIAFAQPRNSELEEEKEARRKSELPFAAYIISHPILEDWELRRNTNDGV